MKTSHLEREALHNNFFRDLIRDQPQAQAVYLLTPLNEPLAPSINFPAPEYLHTAELKRPTINKNRAVGPSLHWTKPRI